MIDSSNAKDISFKGEILRKLTHLGAFIVPGFYYYSGISKNIMLYIMLTVAVAMIIIDISRLRGWKLWDYTGWFIKPLLRRSEIHGTDFTGATYILWAMCATIALFSKPVVFLALSFIIFGDPFSAVIGRRYGRIKFKNKSLEGSLAFLGAVLIVAWLAPEIPFYIGAVGAVVATVTEALSFRVDDNVTVPLMSGLVLTLMMIIFSTT